MSSTHRVYVVDTSYLLELYAVPLCFEPRARDEVRARVGAAMERGDRLYVPVGCHMELGNRVAVIRDAAQRDRWAEHVERIVTDHFKPPAVGTRMVLVPAPAMEELAGFLARWRTEHVRAPRGLVDAAAAEQARTLKRKWPAAQVHIWTRDRALKGAEPDPEPGAFV